MRFLVIILLSFLLLPQMAFADAKSAIDKVNNPKFLTGREQTLSDVNEVKQNQQEYSEQEFKNAKIDLSNTAPAKKSSGMTNYQYDENNLHYYKFQKYIQGNLNYSQSGKMKY